MSNVCMYVYIYISQYRVYIMNSMVMQFHGNFFIYYIFLYISFYIYFLILSLLLQKMNMFSNVSPINIKVLTIMS